MAVYWSYPSFADQAEIEWGRGKMTEMAAGAVSFGLSAIFVRDGIETEKIEGYNDNRLVSLLFARPVFML